MITRRQLPVFLTMLALTLGTADSFAQFGGRGGMTGGARGGRGGQGANPDYRAGRQPQQDINSYDQIEYRLSLLEDDLKLQQGQRPSWDSFADKVRAFAGDLSRERARAMASSSSGATAVGGIKHIEQAADSARNRATALEDIAAAAKVLYASLTPDQKMLADTRIVTIVAPPPRPGPATASAPDLPDLGSSARPQR